MNIKEPPKNRERDGQCPGINCPVCYLKPEEGRCPFFIFKEQKQS